MADAPELALVADIGGTNARFALAEPGGKEVVLRAERVYRTADFPGLEEALQAYIADARPGAAPEAAALAVASPVRGDRVTLTNRAWSFSRAGLRKRFGFRQLCVLNDFEAIAFSLPALNRPDLQRVCGPDTDETGTARVMAVVGPGTGLGVAAVLRAASRFHVIASEGGHTSFAPADAVEMEILNLLLRRFGHVSFERLLSGPGLVTLHGALAEIEGRPADPCSPAELVRRAVGGEDRHCTATLERYCTILGGFAGNTALMFGAGRLFLAGGIVPRFAGFLERSGFGARFGAKGRFAAYLRSIPVDVITRPEPGLLGAARALQAELQGPGASIVKGQGVA